MISDERIKQQLDQTVEQVDIEGLGELHRGKVRDSYKQGDRRVIITSDRLSAFDCVIGTIPFKGQVLTQLAGYWFEQTKDIAPNHVLDIPDPNAMVVSECEQLGIELIVRGYITGVTKTSAWYNYEKGVRNFCGNALPEGLVKDQKLDKPILTPTTKFEKHDRSVSREEAISEGLVDGETFDQAADICFKLFERGTKLAADRGLILVDTKYELGKRDGKLVVSDEIHTPDSSRYWYKDSYEECFKAGEPQRQIDKEYVRRWLADQGFRGDGTPPELPEDIRTEAARRYMSAYEIITGEEFTSPEGPVQDRIEANLKQGGYFL